MISQRLGVGMWDGRVGKGSEPRANLAEESLAWSLKEWIAQVPPGQVRRIEWYRAMDWSLAGGVRNVLRGDDPRSVVVDTRGLGSVLQDE